MGSEDELYKFRTYPLFNFTTEYNGEKIHFLDLVIIVNFEKKLETSVDRKTTDRNTILHASIFHPEHKIKNIPYGQFVRLSRIYRNEKGNEIKVHEMSQRLRQRGYDETLIDQAVENAYKRYSKLLLNLKTQIVE